MSSAIYGNTKNELISQTQSSIGNSSTNLRNYLRTKFNWLESMICGKTDWRFKHKTINFNTVSGTQSYDLTESNVSWDVEDLESLFDYTNGNPILPSNIRIFDKVDPEQDDSGKPSNYAFWEDKTLYLYRIPDDAYTIKARVTVLPTFSTAWGDDEYPLVSREYQGVLQQGLEALAKKYSKHSDWRDDWSLFKDGLMEAVADEADKLESFDRIRDPREEAAGAEGSDNIRDEIWRHY